MLFSPCIVLRRLIHSDAGADYRSIQARLPRSKPVVLWDVLVSFVKSLEALSMAAEGPGPPGQRAVPARAGGGHHALSCRYPPA